MGNPLRVLLHIQAALFDHTDADINDVLINNPVPCGIGVGRARNEAEGKGVESVTGIPVGSHPLAVHVVIFRHRRTAVLSKPLKHVNEDNVQFTEALLLEGYVDPDQNGVKENIAEDGIHCDDVSPCLLVKCMSCGRCDMVIFVGTLGIDQDFVHRGRERCEDVRICIRSEEPIDWLWTRIEKRFIVSKAGERCVWMHRHMWNNSSNRDSSIGIPWIG